MKKTALFLIAFVLLVGTFQVQAAMAQGHQVNSGVSYWHKWHGNPGPPPGPHPGPNPEWNNPPVNRLQDDARFILQRTAMILREAQQIAMRHHYCFGLAQAIAHQQTARDFYWRRNYQAAIFHSLRARNIAFQIIDGNRERLSWNFSWEPREENYCRIAPRDADLDHEIDWHDVGSDDDAVRFHLDIDFNF